MEPGQGSPLMECQPSYGCDHPGLSQCHPDRENPECSPCVHFNQLVNSPALLPPLSPSLDLLQI